MTIYGYAEKVLEIDLSTREVRKVPTDVAMMRKYVGGTGFATRVLYDRTHPGMDPLGPDNLLIITTGPLVGTLAPTSCRVEIVTRSPLTGRIGLSNGGGYWAPALKYAGYEAIILKGIASQPVYLWIDDDTAELRNAEHLWGLDTWETTDRIIGEFPEFCSDRIRVLCIGPAGENLVKFASVTVDYHNSASRTGVGAVMGSKKLKAVVVHGDLGVAVADPKRLMEVALEYVGKGDPYMWGNPGHSYLEARSIGMNILDYTTGRVPGKNYQLTMLPGYESRTLEGGKQYLGEAGRACHACHIGEATARIEHGKYAGVRIGDIHAQPIRDYGALCAIESLPAVFKCQETAERLGMDCTCSGTAIAFAMELYQRGIITREDTDGLALNWGDEEVVLELLHRIAKRQGFGDILAEGAAGAADKIGGEAPKYAMVAGKLAPVPRENRIGTIGARELGHLTNPRGGDNLRTSHLWMFDALPRLRPKGTQGLSEQEFIQWYVGQLDIFEELKKKIYGKPPTLRLGHEQRALLVKFMEEETTLHNALGTCILSLMGPTTLARLYSAVTGETATPQELMEKAERIFTLQWAYNAREGVTRKDTDWPERFYTEPVPDGPHQGKVLSRKEWERARDAYYEARGWDKETGIPTRAKLKELCLDEVISDLEGMGLLGAK